MFSAAAGISAYCAFRPPTKRFSSINHLTMATIRRYYASPHCCMEWNLLFIGLKQTALLTTPSKTITMAGEPEHSSQYLFPCIGERITLLARNGNRPRLQAEPSSSVLLSALVRTCTLVTNQRNKHYWIILFLAAASSSVCRNVRRSVCPSQKFKETHE